MNKIELNYCLTIADKMEWMHKPIKLVLETIQDMVIVLQCKTMAIRGYCKNIQNTLREMASYDKEKLFKLKREARQIYIDLDK